MLKRFKEVLINEYIGVWGDIHLNYRHPVWVFAVKVADNAAIEIQDDGSTGEHILVGSDDTVVCYPTQEEMRKARASHWSDRFK